MPRDRTGRKADAFRHGGTGARIGKITARTILYVTSLCVTIVCTATIVQASAPDRVRIAFPHGYRQWTHLKSGLIDDPAHPAFARFGGLHHIYANALAMSGLRAAAFPDGSVLVYDLHALRRQSDGTVDQGARRHIDVMVKDATRFADTGGWGYEEFITGDLDAPTLSPRTQAACAACHRKDGRHDHVFSDYRE